MILDGTVFGATRLLVKITFDLMIDETIKMYFFTGRWVLAPKLSNLNV